MSFVHLHVHSQYSFLDGASSLERLLEKTKSLGMTALAITDHNRLTGAVRFHEKARSMGIKPIIGAEIDLEGRYHLTLLCKDVKGYSNLCRLLTESHLANKGKPPDYEILKQVENDSFKYSNTDAYIGYTTRGCVRNCPFCAVRTFEPVFIPYVDIKKIVEGIVKEHGEKQNLILLDNNVLASPQFDKIINDIKQLGFVKGATFGPTKRKRIVDFNQGLDARFLDESKMRILAEIPLEPMRLAFDSIKLKNVYLKAARLAHKYGQKEMSNYILYNFDDKPEDFYERLKINIDLNEEFRNSPVKTSIYSFPMRYIPLDAKDRSINTGNGFWNKKYLRSVQVILNVMKGPVMPGKQFFLQAFGRDAEEFKAIASMPDEFIRNRLVHNWKDIDSIEARWMPYVRNWMNEYYKLSSVERDTLVEAISVDRERMKAFYTKSTDRVKKLLKCHLEEDTIVTKTKKS